MTCLRAVVFDMDGLMFNTEELYNQVGAEILRRRGHQFTQQLSHAMMGRPPQPAFELMIRQHSLSDPWERLASESEEIYLGLLDERVAPMPGLLELLDALEAAGIPKAIGTSSQPKLVSATLSRFNLAPRFQFILTAEDITQGKPHPEIYLKAADRFGLQPQQMLVLEDSQIGCRAAAAAEALVIAVPGEHSRDQDFAVASVVVESLAAAEIYEALGLRTAG